MVPKVNKTMKRPKITINCAMTLDGKIAMPNRKQLRISSDEDMKRVHQLRNDCDGILVGIGAVLMDDPKLTVKETFVKDPKQPIRIVLDSDCRTPEVALVVNDKTRTLICCSYESFDKKTYGDHVELIPCKKNDADHLDLSDVLEKLYNFGIRSILVEGGGTIIWNFVKASLVDDLYVYIGPMIVGGKQTPTMADGKGIQKEDERIKLVMIDTKKLGEGLLIHYKLQ